VVEKQELLPKVPATATLFVVDPMGPVLYLVWGGMGDFELMNY